MTLNVWIWQFFIYLEINEFMFKHDLFVLSLKELNLLEKIMQLSSFFNFQLSNTVKYRWKVLKHKTVGYSTFWGSRNIVPRITGWKSLLNIHQVSISSTFMCRFYTCRSQKRTKTLITWLSFLHIWDLRTKKLLVKCWWNWPLTAEFQCNSLLWIKLERFW